MIPLQHGAETREQKELGRLFPQLFVLIVAEMDSVGGRRDGGDCVDGWCRREEEWRRRRSQEGACGG